MIQESEIGSDLRVLCQTIGERLAGSAAERKAADYAAARMSNAGLSSVGIQKFPCTSLQHARIEVAEPKNGLWRQIAAQPIVGTPSTPQGAAVEGELVWLTFPESQHRLRPGSLKGKIAALFGPMPTTIAAHRSLLAAAPAALVHIDDRFPFEWAKSDGSLPYWAKRYGMLPTASVPYMDAWRWRRDDVKRLRVRIEMSHRRTQSVNVVGELPGKDPGLPAITFTSHIDTQPGNAGADDNAGGVASVLALARALGGKPCLRTLRFIAFGAEEQLSVGSAAYVRRKKITPADTGLVLNFDSIASQLGHYVLWSVGDPKLSRSAIRALAGGGIDATVCPEVSPYCDSFPFNRVGIPSVWFRRQNFPGGKWQHHCDHDTLENISVPQLAALLECVAPWVRNLANRKTWPFSLAVPPAQKTHARRLSRELFGW